jgi:thiamine transporter
MDSTRTRVLVETALTIALAAVLHWVTRLWQMPLGGTVSLEMLPLLVLAVRRGPVVGITAGALYGMVDLAMEPYVVHWVQFFLDYPIAFGLVGLAGLWTPVLDRLEREGKLALATAWVVPLAVVTGAAARYAAHFLSGVVFFATTTFQGPLAPGHSAFESVAALRTVAVYSALYNLYVPISAVACLAAMLLIVPALERAVPRR